MQGEFGFKFSPGEPDACFSMDPEDRIQAVCTTDVLTETHAKCSLACFDNIATIGAYRLSTFFRSYALQGEGILATSS